MKNTATVQHRDYVPYGWIAIEFCSVEFSGPDKQKLQSAWHDIEFSKYHQHDAEIKRIEKEKQELESDRNILESKLTQKPWYRFWITRDEQNLQTQLCDLESKISQLDERIEELTKNRFFKASELVRKARKFMEDNGFYLHNTSSSGDECITHTDIYWSDN